METVTIATVEAALKKDGSPYQKVTFGDGRKFSAFNDDFTPFVGKQVVVDTTTKGSFWNVYLHKEDKPAPTGQVAPSTGGYANKYPPKVTAPNDLDYRKEAARFGLGFMELVVPEKRDRVTIAATIKWFENYLRTGEFDLPKDQPQA